MHNTATCLVNNVVDIMILIGTVNFPEDVCCYETHAENSRFSLQCALKLSCPHPTTTCFVLFFQRDVFLILCIFLLI